MNQSDQQIIKNFEELIQKKINYLTKHPDDHNAKKLPGLVEALKDLHEIRYQTN